jgi:hypothetical protein
VASASELKTPSPAALNGHAFKGTYGCVFGELKTDVCCSFWTTAVCPRQYSASLIVFPVIATWWVPATDTVADLPEGGAEDI